MRGLIRRFVMVAGAAALVFGSAAGAVVATGPAAQADSPCTTSGTTTTCTYTGAGTYSFTVPAGVTSLDVTAVGASGGTACVCGGRAFIGGPGASVEDTAVPVNSGQTFMVVVGAPGGTGTSSAGGAGGSPGAGGAGGDPNGSATLSAGGGGGGGYSGLVSPSGVIPFVIAGGGGGGGNLNGPGGAGDTGSGGGAGAGFSAPPCPASSSDPTAACGGGGGSSTAGGTGGAGAAGNQFDNLAPGGSGSDGAHLAGGQGGASTPGQVYFPTGPSPTGQASSGGGGGGGLYGGGGGGSGGGASTPSLGSGSGGGGSSFGTGPGLTNETTATGPASVTISYNFASTTTTLISSAFGQPVLYGMSVTFTAFVAPPPNGGTVAFTVGGTTISGCGAQPVIIGSNGGATATCTTSALPVGNDSITASYSGYNSYAASSGTVTQPVSPRATTTTLTSSANPSAVGTAVTYTATLNLATGVGTVSFTDNGAPIAGCSAVPVSGATATCSPPASQLGAGAHNITAAYSGFGGYVASTSATLTQIVTSTACQFLSGCNLSGLNLSNAQLSGATLTGANLTGATLTGANLSGAIMYGANLSGATLTSANLSSANLSGVNLNGANLSGANLTGAHLNGANLSGANLTGANLTGANLTGANLTKAQLLAATVTASTVLTNVSWSATLCPDYTNSNNDGGTCIGHLTYKQPDLSTSMTILSENAFDATVQITVTNNGSAPSVAATMATQVLFNQFFSNDTGFDTLRTGCTVTSTSLQEDDFSCPIPVIKGGGTYSVDLTIQNLTDQSPHYAQVTATTTMPGDTNPSNNTAFASIVLQ